MMLTFQDYLKEYQYKTADNLNARVALHTKFGTNTYGWQKWVYDQLDLQSGMLVMEAGSGPGWLWFENLDKLPDNLDVVVGDLSVGMLVEAWKKLFHKPAFRYINFDVQSIPFPDHFFDRVVANHMLYHVPDIQRAVCELWRVLKPDGIVFAATNGIGNMRELTDLIRKYKPEYQGIQAQTPRFSLENAEHYFANIFRGIEVRRYQDDLVVTQVEPLIAYILSIWDTFSQDESAKLAALEADARHVIQSRGAYFISKSQGIIVAWK